MTSTANPPEEPPPASGRSAALEQRVLLTFLIYAVLWVCISILSMPTMTAASLHICACGLKYSPVPKDGSAATMAAAAFVSVLLLLVSRVLRRKDVDSEVRWTSIYRPPTLAGP